MRRLLLPLGLLILFAVEIMRVYFIMPFPGSQKSNTIAIAYFLNKYIWLIRLFALVLIRFGIWPAWRGWKNWKRILFIAGVLVYLLIFYMVNYKFLADKMFYQPRQKLLANNINNRVGPDKLVLGITLNGDSKAYPIEMIGYHHLVRDTIGGMPVMVTYCTVCRTGRVFSPVLDGKMESFRLVGMDHFNAMFEDKRTKSWWRQATGEAVAGPLKGEQLTELPSEQMRLEAWLRAHPNSLVLQPDPSFTKKYDDLSGFDLGIINSGLEKRDPGSWNFKSWVIGIRNKNESRAYDWNGLLSKRIIIDSLAGLPLLIIIETDNASFHVWDRRVNGEALNFTLNNNLLTDMKTNSVWNPDGTSIEGPLKGSQLRKVQASQEFWHSWKQFHPNTTVYK